MKRRTLVGIALGCIIVAMGLLAIPGSYGTFDVLTGDVAVPTGISWFDPRLITIGIVLPGFSLACLTFALVMTAVAFMRPTVQPHWWAVAPALGAIAATMTMIVTILPFGVAALVLLAVALWALLIAPHAESDAA